MNKRSRELTLRETGFPPKKVQCIRYDAPAPMDIEPIFGPPPRLVRQPEILFDEPLYPAPEPALRGIWEITPADRELLYFIGLPPRLVRNPETSHCGNIV